MTHHSHHMYHRIPPTLYLKDVKTCTMTTLNFKKRTTSTTDVFSTLGYWTPEPEHVRNSPITGKPYPDDEIKEELQQLEESATRHTQLRRNVLQEKY